MTDEQLKRQDEVRRALSRDFPKDAIESAPKEKTRKSYNATFIKYIHLCERFNEVLGAGNWSAKFDIISTNSGKRKTKSGYESDFWHVVGRMVIEGDEIGYNESFGGHTSFESEETAYKAAWTDGFKKAAAIAGNGWKTYAGLLEPDNETHPDYIEKQQRKSSRKLKPKSSENAEKDLKERESIFNDIYAMAKRLDPDHPAVFFNNWAIEATSGKWSSDAWKNVDKQAIPKIKSKFERYIKERLEESQTDQEMITEQQIKKYHAVSKAKWGNDSEIRKDFLRYLTSKSSSKELTKVEASLVIQATQDQNVFDESWRGAKGE